MAAFDFIDSAVKGYRFVWNERRRLLRLAALPFAIKMGSFSAVILLGLQDNFLRQGLFLLPAYFAEGWLLSTVLRYAFVPERISRKEEHSKAVMAGMLLYVLIQLIVSLFAGLAMTGEAQAPSPPPEPTVQTALLGMFLLALLIWAFRLLWVFIPVALGYSVRGFLKKTKGYSTSFYMIGTWLLCLVPLATLVIIFSQILLGIFPEEGAVSDQVRLLILGTFQIVIELFIALVSALGMAYGIRSIYEGKKPERFF